MKRLLVLATTALIALVFVPSALAARGHVFEEETIGTPCAAAPCAPGELKEPSAVAVNEATNEVYVIDQGNSRVQILDGETGAFLGGFDGSATPAGEFSFGGEAQNGAIAVDNSCQLQEPPLTELTTPICAEFDPSNGDIYVADAGHRVVDKFSPTGAYLGQITEAGSKSFATEGLDGVAVDPEGHLWIYREEPVADQFSSAQPNVFVKTVPLGSGFGRPGFAVDSARNFYARHPHGGEEDRIAKDASTGTVINAELDTEDSSAVATDQREDVAYVDNFTSVVLLGPAGNTLEEFDFESELVEGGGIGVDAASGFAYVADTAGGRLLVLAPTKPGAPTVEAEAQSVSEVGSDAATLQGEVNPRSEPDEATTTYRFEYGPCASPMSCASSAFPLATPEGTLPADFEGHPVSASIAGLSPATTYHFRIRAANSHGPTVGEETIFTTQSEALFMLPDSRQWEMVSPPEKLGAQFGPIEETGVVEAAASGSGITYLGLTPIGPEPQGYSNREQILSTRGATGWSSRDIGIFHASASGYGVGSGLEYKFFDPSLSLAAVQPFGEFNPALSPEASESTAFLSGLGGSCAGSCLRPLTTGRTGFANVPEAVHFGEAGRCTPAVEGGASIECGPRFLGATESLDHIVLRAKAELVPGAGEEQLYEWSAGALTPISVLPGGEPAPTAPTPALGLEGESARGAISEGGNRIVWESIPNLYLRDVSRGETVQLDAAKAGCVGCESGGGEFQFASSDGSRAFFTDTKALTEGSGALPAVAADLYECRIVVSGSGALECELTDLTPETGGKRASVQGTVLGAAADGSALYFVADGILATNSVENGNGPEEATAGQPNLYVRDRGVTRFIATLANEDRHDWNRAGTLRGQPTRVSVDGQWLELMSQRSLTGYDNRDRKTSRPSAEVYLYHLSAAQLRCASCDPTGARPVGVEYHKLEPGSGGLVGGPRETWEQAALVAANVPGWTNAGGVAQKRYQPRYLSNSGRLFFNTVNSLDPADSNGTQDVYEYEPPGVGSCIEASPSFAVRSGGCIGLISSGSSERESAFLDASESGEDVFFLTAARLAKQDTDSALDVYDAHVCGAVACLPEPPAAPIPCSGEACRAPGTAPAAASPQTQDFSGPGNLKPKSHRQKHHHKKHKQKRHKQRHEARTGHGRRAQR